MTVCTTPRSTKTLLLQGILALTLSAAAGAALPDEQASADSSAPALEYFDESVQDFLKTQGIDDPAFITVVDHKGNTTLFAAPGTTTKRLTAEDFDTGIYGRIRQVTPSSMVRYGDATCVVYQMVVNGQLVTYQVCY